LTLAVETDKQAKQDLSPRILVADPLAPDGLERLERIGHVDVATGLSSEELLARIGDYDALVVRSETQVTADVLQAGAKLRVVGRAGVGVDNIDLDAATSAGVLVVNAPTGNTVAAAEHVIGVIFALMRNIPKADAAMHSGGWDRKRFTGQELRGKTLGLLGLGKIGYEVARMASQGLQMSVIAYDPLVTADRAEQAGAGLVDFDTLLETSDILSVHVPLTPKTRGIISKKELHRMRKGSRVVNVARGGIIDENDLEGAIKDGHIAGAAVDVFTTEPLPPDHPLRLLNEVVLTPHLGASTEEAQVNVATDVADQIGQYLSGETPPHAVNAPAILSEDAHRLKPYLSLSFKLGSLAGQLTGTGIRQLTCSYSKELAGTAVHYLTAEALRGLFAHFTEARINPVNARVVASSHGIAVEERTTTESLDGAAAVQIEAVGDGTLVVAGALVHGEPRITRIGGFRLDMGAEGIFLVGSHTDRPGVVAVIARLLAAGDINIAGIELGRDTPRGRAVMVMQVDDPVSPALAAQIQREAGLDQLTVVEL
jgi:D-3-phosphoglycerate dehydrogenase